MICKQFSVIHKEFDNFTSEEISDYHVWNNYASFFLNRNIFVFLGWITYTMSVDGSPYDSS